mgnify:FL=1
MSIITIDGTGTTVKRKDFLIPGTDWSRNQWLKFYHINNEVPEHLSNFISNPVQRRFCGCILSESESQQFLKMFPELKVYYRTQATFGTADLNPCQGYTVDLGTGKLTKAEMGTDPRYSFIFEKKPAQRT